MFYLDMSELPDDTRPKLHRLSQIILSIIRNLFPQDSVTSVIDDLLVEVHINNGYMRTDDGRPGTRVPVDVGRGYVIGPVGHTGPLGPATSSCLHHIVVSQEAVKPGREDRFAHDLSHELGHILFGVNHNNALIETFCVAFSFFMLEKLNKYAKANPKAGFESGHFLHCRTTSVAGMLRVFPAEIRSAVQSELWYQLSLYLRYKRAEIDAHTYGIHEDYRFSVLGALLLTSQAVPWSEMAGIAALGTMGEVEGNPDPQWQMDLTQLTPNVQQSLRRVGRGSDQDFLIAKFDTLPWLFGGFRFYEEGRFVWLVEFPKHKREKWKKKIAALNSSSVLWEGV